MSSSQARSTISAGWPLATVGKPRTSATPRAGTGTGPTGSVTRCPIPAPAELRNAVVAIAGSGAASFPAKTESWPETGIVGTPGRSTGAFEPAVKVRAAAPATTRQEATEGRVPQARGSAGFAAAATGCQLASTAPLANGRGTLPDARSEIANPPMTKTL